MADEISPAHSPPPAEVQDKDKTPPTDAAEDASGTPENDDSGSDDKEGTPADEADLTKSASPDAAPAPDAGNWQAVWSPQYNAYYFFNAVTQETTWTNPLESTSSATPASDPTPTSTDADDKGEGSSSGYSALQAAAVAQGIDPSLAYLDPSLAGPGGSAGAYAHQAKFNARTGAFTKLDGRDPSHLSEFERAKRMSEFYFDVGQWEQDVEARKEAEAADGGKKRKRPTKKDLVRICTPMSVMLVLIAFGYRSGSRSRKG
jgi:hypothetical protein